jgi:predicted TIM-barrel fold metal-dependent hydrolase
MKHDDVAAVDFDDPRYAFKTPLTEAERRKIFNGNARAVYGF